MDWFYLGVRAFDAYVSQYRQRADVAGKKPNMNHVENAALPHGSGTDRKLQWGDFILVDVGGQLHGYISDVTRVSIQPLLLDTQHLVSFVFAIS